MTPEKVYLIKKAWASPLENEISAAFWYEPIGFVETEEEAQKIHEESRTLDRSFCWAVSGSPKEYIYTELDKFYKS